MPAPHQPTYDCPHRWCRPLHRAVIAAAFPAIVMAVLFGGLPVLALLTLAVVIVFGLMMLHYGYDLRGFLPKGEDPLPVRRAWAAAAVLTDVLHVLAGIALVVLLATDPGAAAVPPPTPAGYTGLVLALALLISRSVTHYQATAVPETADEAPRRTA
ncbi:hypothetical protein AB0H73_38595 [Streptomyces olivoreticuli]